VSRVPGDYRDVLIATPVRDGRFHTGYVVGLMQSTGLHNGWLPCSGQSDIYLARNALMDAFLLQPQYATLVCIDSDIGFTRDDLQRLIDAEPSVVSGIYTDKAQPPMPFCRDANGINVPLQDIPPEGMLRSRFIPGGFFKVERSVLETIVSEGLVESYGTEEDIRRAFYVTRFTTNAIGRYMVSEDFSFSVLLEEAGVQPWTHCGIRVNHDGRTWDGKPCDEST
jgi:hypothetical protein